MSYYVTSQVEKPNFQALETNTGNLWPCYTNLPEVLLNLSLESHVHTTCQSIEKRLEFIETSGGGLRTFTYYGPFNTVDDLSSYFINNHPELLL